MEYTKGEWWIDKGDFGYTIKAEQSIATGFNEDNDVEIAELNTYLDNESEIMANARLIAAAPDLYEACKQALRTFEVGNIKSTDPRYLMLRQAIAKAGK